jgi:hypothetical protein
VDGAPASSAELAWLRLRSGQSGLLVQPFSRLLALMWFARRVLITNKGSTPLTRKKALPPRRPTDRHHAVCTSATRDALVTFIYPTRLASEARWRAGVRHALGHLRPSASLAPARRSSNPNSRTKKSGKPRKAQYRSRHKPKHLSRQAIPIMLRWRLEGVVLTRMSAFAMSISRSSRLRLYSQTCCAAWGRSWHTLPVRCSAAIWSGIGGVN